MSTSTARPLKQSSTAQPTSVSSCRTKFSRSTTSSVTRDESVFGCALSGANRTSTWRNRSLWYSSRCASSSACSLYSSPVLTLSSRSTVESPSRRGAPGSGSSNTRISPICARGPGITSSDTRARWAMVSYTV